MALALKLAKRRKGQTHPNPTVGAVVVKDSRIVGIGYHRRAGEDHAEVVALKKAGVEARNSTLYVTLEPCSHYGRTPPCTDAILRYGVKRVVVGVRDPNLKVSGIDLLKEKGLEVVEGILREEAWHLNEDFFTYVRERRPYITLKMAQTLDGKMATVKGDSKWITSIRSRRFAHKLRAEATAVAVGVNTVIMDDPQLTVRHLPVEEQPKRVIFDPDLEIPIKARVVSDGNAQTLIIHKNSDPEKEERLSSLGVRLIKVEDYSLKEILSKLYEEGIVHLLVEGGPYTLGRFLEENLWDRIVIFTAPKVLGEGLSLTGGPVGTIKEAIHLKVEKRKLLGDEEVLVLRRADKESLRW